jgi:NAD dependent epimerase/dehydratase
MINKILITGADGFIGSHLTDALVRLGYNVKAFVFYNSFNSYGWIDELDDDIQKSIDIFPGDIRDPFGVRKAMENCDIVLHLAALIAIPYSYHSPDTYIDTNIKGTLNILQAAKDLNIKKIIHTSTSEVYGTAQFVPITEEHPIKGQSPYSASKIGADQIAYSFFASFNLPVTIIRPFNTYGPRQSARAVIPTIITQLASGLEKIKIGSLSPTRDFNYVEDIVSGFISSMESKNTNGEIINLGSNYEISIGETVNLISNLMNKKINIDIDNDRVRPLRSEVERLWASNLKAKNLLGWEPKYSGIEGLRKGLEKTIEWFVKNENLKKYKINTYNI